MKRYVTPKLSLLLPETEDILTSSPAMIEWNADDGEYWVGGSADWWSGNGTTE